MVSKERFIELFHETVRMRREASVLWFVYFVMFDGTRTLQPTIFVGV